MWATLKALCLHSATIALGYVVTFIGLVFQSLDAINYITGGQDFRDWVTQTFAAEPKVLAWIFTILGFLVIVARLRSIVGIGGK
jgi:hypothetical protein